jgi:hypothetical protein
MKNIKYLENVKECLEDESQLEKRLIRIDFNNAINNVLPVDYCANCKKYLVKNKREKYRMEENIKRVALSTYNSNYSTTRKLKEIQRVEIVEK